MYTEEQKKLMGRIDEEFELLMKEESGALPVATLDSYRRDITLLCSPEYFTPVVMNYAMDIMKKIAVEREKHDRVALAILQSHTYERFRIRPEVKEKERLFELG